MVNDKNSPETAEKEELKGKGKKALIVNIVFFIALFVVILLVPKIGVVPAAAVIILFFIASLLYIYRF